MTFPKEFERSFFRDFDRGFFLIWLVTFVVFNGLTLYMQGQPVKQLTMEEIEKYTAAIYRVRVATPQVVERVTEAAGAGEEAVVEEEEEVEGVEISEVERREQLQRRREEQRATRQARQTERRQEIAQRVGILAAPVAKGQRRRGGARAAGEAIGLRRGGTGGVDVGKMVGMVGTADMREKVEKLRGGGAIATDVGDIDIAAFQTLSAEDLDMILNEAPVALNRSAITAKGKGTKARQRSQAAISDIVLRNKSQVQYCYWALKRRDSNLKGRVEIEFIINPAGEVIRVRIRNSNWGGNRLGAEVERCIKNIISQWHFDPIGEKEGNVTAGATYIFQ